MYFRGKFIKCISSMYVHTGFFFLWFKCLCLNKYGPLLLKKFWLRHCELVSLGHEGEAFGPRVLEIDLFFKNITLIFS